MPGPVSDTAPPLYWKMRKLANSGHSRAADLRREANLLEQAVLGGTAPVSKLAGVWVRARRLWCECTGDDLV